ncbi:hypothetical protein [Methylobacillus sp. Pita1]|uniref:hypothetical protein n=1 Tax=Methylobacillus sp. Pita1 TaxID=3382642 RepID=UPI0038B578C9
MSEIVYELYDALKAINIPEDKAKAAAEAMNRAVDKRYNIHADQLATKGDLAAIRSEITDVRRELADAKVEIIKWSVGSIFVAVGVVAAIVRMLG